MSEETQQGYLLLQAWKKQLDASSLSKDNVVYKQLDKGLNETNSLLDKVSQSRELRTQIDRLKNGPVKSHMHAALQHLEAEIGVSPAESGPQESWELKVIVQDGKEQNIVLRDLAPSSTINMLKERIEHHTGISADQQKLCLFGSRQIISDSNSCALSALPIQNRDALLLIVKEDQSARASSIGALVQAVSAKCDRAAIRVKGPQDALAIACHIIMLLEGFTCLVEEGCGIPGFAPALRDVSESRLVGSGWNTNPADIHFMYRHNLVRGTTVQLKMTWLDERVMVELMHSKGEPRFTANLHGPEYVDVSARGMGDALPKLRNLDALRCKLRTCLVQPFLPQPTNPTTPIPSNPDTMRTGRPSQPGEPPFGIHIPSPLGPMPPRGGFGGRTGGLVPDFEGDLRPGGPGIGDPGGGNLMGPTHPTFTGEGRHGGFGVGMPGMRMPAPRFDPYGPVSPPTRGGPPARGMPDPNDPRGRGQAFRDPNPDHLPPPGFGNFFF